MSGEVFDQNRNLSSHAKSRISKNNGVQSGMKQVEQGGSKKANQEQIDKINKRVSDVVIFAFFLIIIYYILNLNFYQTVDCTVVSARATSGGGGLRASSSSQGVDVETEECGLIVFTRMQNEGFDSARDLADELNRHLGETLTFRVSYLHWGPYTARAVELEGFPIRD